MKRQQGERRLFHALGAVGLKNMGLGSKLFPRLEGFLLFFFFYVVEGQRNLKSFFFFRRLWPIISSIFLFLPQAYEVQSIPSQWSV